MILNLIKFIYWRGGAISLFYYMEYEIRKIGLKTQLKMDAESRVITYHIYRSVVSDSLPYMFASGGFNFNEAKTIAWILDKSNFLKTRINERLPRTKERMYGQLIEEMCNGTNSMIKDAKKDGFSFSVFVENNTVFHKLNSN